jgi:PhnB protein
VRDSAQAVKFYQQAFGAVEVYHLEGPEGGVVSRLSIQGGEFWLSDEAPEAGNFSPHTLGGATARLIRPSPTRMQWSPGQWLPGHSWSTR